jgi:7-cyano-7-deazaguanine synthase
MKAAVLFSGGIDSTAVTLASEKHMVGLFMNYGQRAAEMEGIAARKLAEYFTMRLEEIDIDKRVFGKHCLDTNPMFADYLPLGDSVPVVPGRNALLITTGIAWCQAHGFSELHVGLHKTDSGVPDSNQEFFRAMSTIAQAYDVELVAPFLNDPKEVLLDVVFRNGLVSMTWSCYDNGPKHCGICGACKAVTEAGSRI